MREDHYDLIGDLKIKEALLKEAGLWVGQLPEKCKACSVALPLRTNCYRAFCDEKVEKMAVTEDIARRELEQAAFQTPAQKKTKIEGDFLLEDSGDAFIKDLAPIAADDAEGLKRAQASYGNSWKKRGGVGAYMMLARKIDRMELQVSKHNFDIFEAIAQDPRSEGIIDDIRDLRRYLLLVEAEMVARGFDATHRDNS